MQIQSRKLYENRTWRYLYPSLKCYGKELMDYLVSFFKLGVGVGDSNKDIDSTSIFILFETSLPLTTPELEKYQNNFSKFLDWIKYQPYYVTDYVFDMHNKHMVVIKLPYKHSSAYMHFIKGKYSLMYNETEIKQYFSEVSLTNKILESKINKNLDKTIKILTRDRRYVQNFVDIVNKDFDANITVEQYLGNAELDYPPKKEEEIFNYKKRE